MCTSSSQSKKYSNRCFWDDCKNCYSALSSVKYSTAKSKQVGSVMSISEKEKCYLANEWPAKKMVCYSILSMGFYKTAVSKSAKIKANESPTLHLKLQSWTKLAAKNLKKKPLLKCCIFLMGKVTNAPFWVSKIKAFCKLVFPPLHVVLMRNIISCFKITVILILRDALYVMKVGAWEWFYRKVLIFVCNNFCPWL